MKSLLTRRTVAITLALVLMILFTTSTSAVQTVQAQTQIQSEIFTQTALSDGRLEQWRTLCGQHWIESRWQEDDGSWTPWESSDYPSDTTAGVVELYSYTDQNQITYLVVKLDDQTTRQQHKLTKDSRSGWSKF